MKKVLSLFLFCLIMACGCARNPDGSYTISAGSIVEGARTGKLITEKGAQSIAQAPAGQIRIYGSLESDGAYICDDTYLGLEWDSAAVGTDLAATYPEGSGSWFYADIDPSSGKIVTARLFFLAHGTRSSVYETVFSKGCKGSLGYVKPDRFAITFHDTVNVSYPGFDEYAGGAVKEPMDATAVVMGRGNLLKARNGAIIPVKLYIGFGNPSIPKVELKLSDCKNDDYIVSGFGKAKVSR